MISLWKKYYFIELLKVFILFIGAFYFLYVLIDYSSHAKAFQKAHIPFTESLLYYSYQFAKRAEILLPIALMISTIKVLTTSNLRNEIVALATGGLSLKKIVSPFLWAALFASVLLYLNFQFLHPFSTSRIETFEEHYFKDLGKKHTRKSVNSLILQDNTLLIYQNYDPQKKAFFDVFWMKNNDQLYRIKLLFPYEKIPFGKYVDSLMRTSEGDIVKLASHEHLFFKEMRFDTKALFNAAHPPRMQSISQLAHSLNIKNTHFGMSKMNDREAEIATFFYYKLLIPLLCFFVVIGVVPHCLQFSRQLPVFFIYALSLFGIITFFTIINSSVILAQNQVIPPLVAICVPQLALSFILGWKYAKL